MDKTARYKLNLRTPESTINATGTLQSPQQWAVVNAALSGNLTDDLKLLAAAPSLLAFVQNVAFGSDAETHGVAARELLERIK